MRLDLSGAIDTYNRTTRQRGEPVMTQRELAKQAGVGERTVSRHARGCCAPGTETLLRYARVLRCRIDELFSDELDMPSVA